MIFNIWNRNSGIKKGKRTEMQIEFHWWGYDGLTTEQ